MPVTSKSGEQLDSIRKSIQSNAAFDFPYVTMNALAAVIATYGLLADSTAVVIGAMIVAMLLGPLMGIAMALVDANNRLLKEAMLAEVGGAVLVFAIALVIGRVHQDVPLGAAIISRTAPNLMDLFVALAGGAAGAYVTVKPRISTGLVGVAIATAVVPPLCACAITLARGEVQMAFGGFLLFLANLVAIQFASSVVFVLNGYHDIGRVMGESRKSLLFLHGPSIVLLLVLTGVLGLNLQRTLSSRRFEMQVRKALVGQLHSLPGTYLADVRIEPNRRRTLVTAVVRTPYSLEPRQVALMQSSIPNHNPPVELHIRSVLTKEATAKGWLHKPSVRPADSSD